MAGLFSNLREFLVEHWDTISVSVCLFMYAMTAYIRYNKGDLPMALVFGAYAIANIGFIWHFWRT